MAEQNQQQKSERGFQGMDDTARSEAARSADSSKGGNSSADSGRAGEVGKKDSDR